MNSRPAAAGFICRQGDVLLKSIPAPAADKLEKAPRDPRGLVFAEGETSGHHHVIFGRGAKLLQYKQSGQRVVVFADAGADIRMSALYEQC